VSDVKTHIMRLLLSFSLMLLAISTFCQSPGAEHYRYLGYLARINAKPDSSIYYYSKVLEINGFDYDAHLALARLYLNKEDFEKAFFHYGEIYKSDNSDGEALLGFAKICFRKGDFQKSGYYYDLALKPTDAFLPFYLERAKTLIYQGKLDSAILIYKQAIGIDQTLAEAWAGAGKMYYWQNKPYQALSYYQHAIALDPGNTENERIYHNLKKETAFICNTAMRSVMEAEESYQINALVSTVSSTKRITDYFNLSLAVLLDISDKHYEWQNNDTQRIFTNFRITGTFMGEKNRLTVYAGYSGSDKIFSSYGAYYTAIWRIKTLKFYNTTAAAYDYFYYWNQVGQDYFANNLSAIYNKLTFNASFRYGIIRKNEIADFEHQKYEPDVNPYYTYAFSARYRILNNPSLSVGLNYSFMDFTYSSPLYYTPKGRKLTGISTGFYQAFFHEKLYFYAAGNYNIGRELYYEESVQNPGSIVAKTLNVDNINWETETGYNFKSLSISAGYSGFINPYYKNRVIFGNLIIYF